MSRVWFTIRPFVYGLAGVAASWAAGYFLDKFYGDGALLAFLVVFAVVVVVGPAVFLICEDRWWAYPVKDGGKDGSR